MNICACVIINHAYSPFTSNENGRPGGSEREAGGCAQGEDGALLGANEELVQKKGTFGEPPPSNERGSLHCSRYPKRTSTRRREGFWETRTSTFTTSSCSPSWSSARLDYSPAATVSWPLCLPYHQHNIFASSDSHSLAVSEVPTSQQQVIPPTPHPPPQIPPPPPLTASKPRPKRQRLASLPLEPVPYGALDLRQYHTPPRVRPSLSLTYSLPHSLSLSGAGGREGSRHSLAVLP